MAIGDIYQLVLKGSYLGEPTNNVFHYVTTAVGTGLGAEQLIDGFDPTLMNVIAGAVSNQASFSSLEAVRLVDPTDTYATAPSVTAGTNSSAPGNMPAWDVLAVRFNRAGAGTRYARKRFSGLAKNMTTGNGLDSGYAGFQATAFAAFANSVISSGWSFRYCQVRHPTPLGVNPILNFLITSVVEVDLGHQDSRDPDN